MRRKSDRAAVAASSGVVLDRSLGTVLVTGFEPFDGQTINPSADVACAVSGLTIARYDVIGAVLPCVFHDAGIALRRHIRKHRPRLVICVGQAGGRSAISLERIAINIDDASIADNHGQRPVDRPIVRKGPVGYWSTLPIKAIVGALIRKNIPAEISQTAGTFVCNHVFYSLMQTIADTSCRGGFIHIPYVPEQVAAMTKAPACLPLELAVHAVTTAIEVSLRQPKDTRVTGGATH
jgi:pyroglutamyl-peptidase